MYILMDCSRIFKWKHGPWDNFGGLYNPARKFVLSLCRFVHDFYQRMAVAWRIWRQASVRADQSDWAA